MKKKLKAKMFPRIKIGEKRAFPCIEESDGTHFISSLKYGIKSHYNNFPMGTSFEVFTVEDRKTKPTHDINVEWHEIRIGDQILEVNRFQADKMYVRFYSIYGIQNNAVLVFGVSDEIFHLDD